MNGSALWRYNGNSLFVPGDKLGKTHICRVPDNLYLIGYQIWPRSYCLPHFHDVWQRTDENCFSYWAEPRKNCIFAKSTGPQLWKAWVNLICFRTWPRSNCLTHFHEVWRRKDENSFSYWAETRKNALLWKLPTTLKSLNQFDRLSKWSLAKNGWKLFQLLNGNQLMDGQMPGQTLWFQYAPKTCFGA